MPFTTFDPLPSRPTCPAPLLPTCGDTLSQQLRAASQWCAGSVPPSRDDPTLWHLASTPGCPRRDRGLGAPCPELTARRHWHRRAGSAALLTTAVRVTERRTAHKYSNVIDHERPQGTATGQRPAPTTANDLPAESSHRGDHASCVPR